MPQCRFQIFKLELVTARLQSVRDDSGGSQQQFVSHFTQDQPGGEGGQRKERRTFQHAAQRFGELAVGDRIRNEESGSFQGKTMCSGWPIQYGASLQSRYLPCHAS